MHRKLTVIVLLCAFAISAAAHSREPTLQGRTKESVAGVWKGKFEETPAVDITLKVDGGKLVGTAKFYYVQNTDQGPVVNSTKEAPLVEPSFDGSTLLFKVKREDGTFFGARMKFIADNEAVLKPVDDSKATDPMEITLFRGK